MGNFSNLAKSALERQKVSSFFPLAKETGNFCSKDRNFPGNLVSNGEEKSHTALGFKLETDRETIRKLLSENEETLTPKKEQKSFLHPPYAKSRMQELRVTADDLIGKNDPTMALDPDELKHVLSSVEAFYLWLEHVHLHKEMRRFGIGPYKSLAVKEPS